MSKSKASRFLEKIAVESEPGLTTSQLMLVNHDLKPGKYSINLQLKLRDTYSLVTQSSPNVDNGVLGIL